MKFLVIFTKYVGLCIAAIGLYVSVVYKPSPLLYYLGLFMIIIGLIITIVGFMLDSHKPKTNTIEINKKHKCPLCHYVDEFTQTYCIECGYTFKEEDIV